MALTGEDFEQLADYMKNHLAEWLAEKSLGKPPAVYEIELRERMVRVEEELKHQRDLILRGFDLMEKGFSEVSKRFEQVDKRFAQVDKRFEQVDKRFEQMDERFERRFEALTKRIDRFMIWSFSVTISVGAIIIAAMKLW